jgi:signal transduction histidine kinase/ActR/RegA family two-component response regulator
VNINDTALSGSDLEPDRGSGGVYLKQLLGLTQALFEAESSQQMMVLTLAHVERAVALDGVAIWQGEGERARVLARYGRFGPTIPDTLHDLAVPQAYFENLRRNGIIVADRVLPDNFWYFVGAKSTISLLLTAQSQHLLLPAWTGSMLGLSLVRFSESPWTLEQQQFLQLVAQALVAALERHQNTDLWHSLFKLGAGYKVLVDENLNVIDVNLSALRWMGLDLDSIESFRGLPYQETPLAQPLAGQEQMLTECIEQALGGTPASFELDIGLDGRNLVLDCMASPFYDRSGRVSHVLVQGHNISAERLQQRALDKINQARSAFFARLSHELRTPLSVILGHTQLLALDNSDSSLQSILDAGQHMVYLLDELLDLARMDADHLHMSHEALDLAGLLNEVLVMFLPIANQKQLRLLAKQPDELAAVLIEADAQRVRQVLMNLISNAVKFNREGGSIVVSLSIIASNARIEIEDTGLGIENNNIARLFVPFERLGMAHIEGTGLGLVLAKRLVELMNGQIGVSSVLGADSVFWIEFPLLLLPQPQAQQPWPGEAAGYSTAKPVLYVEDDEANRRLLQYLASKNPHIQLECAENLEQALKLLDVRWFSVVVIDLHLPDGSGVEVIRHIRRHDPANRLPVIVTSADAFAQNDPELQELVVQLFLPKPVSAQALLSHIEEYAFEHLSRR